MVSSGCAERASYLLSDSSLDSKSDELSEIFVELYRNFKKSLSCCSDHVLKLFMEGKISRCLEAEWCIPKVVSCEQYVPLR